MKVDTGVIQNAFMNKYLQYERYRGMVYKKCLDVVLADKPYFIRFTDDLNEKYWTTIIETSDFSKTITVKFQSRLLHDHILYNPNEVIMADKVIIPANSKKWFIGIFTILATTVIGICIYYFNSFRKVYKEGPYLEDKETRIESLWKLVMVWIDE